MALEIVWTKRAISGYDKIIAHLEKHWTEKEVPARSHLQCDCNLQGEEQKEAFVMRGE